MNQAVCHIFFLLSALHSFSQTVSGKVLAQPGKEPMAFVNIGILNSTVGTITNQDGTFSLHIPVAHLDDTLLVSALGYGRRYVPVKALLGKSSEIYLSEKVMTLQPVTVSARKDKQKSFALGNRFTKGGFLYADSVSSGAAMALLIENKYPAFHEDLEFPVYLEKAILFIDKNSMNPFRIRIRIMEYDSISGFPGRDLLTESVIETSSMKYGWLDFDLTSYHVQVDRPFFLVFEWIMEDKDRLNLLHHYATYRKNNPDKVTADTIIVRGEKIGFRNYLQFSPGTHFGISATPFSLKHYRSCYRLNSFGEWKNAPVVLSARISVSNQPFNIKATTDAKSPQKEECEGLVPPCAAERIFETFVQDYAVNGMQLTVSHKGKIAFSRAYGFSDAEQRIPATSNTRFRIGSISKSLTSAALVKLVSEGKLDIDVPIERYVPSYPKKKYSVTTRHLATHLSGIRHYDDKNPADLVRFEHYPSATAATSIFVNDTLLFEPGSRYLYSSLGWNLIGAVIESVTGEPYLKYMSRNIWRPLKMAHTCGDDSDSVIADVSKLYSPTGEALPRDDVSYKYPSGGLLSTAEDLVKYANELLHPKILNAKAVSGLFETHHTTGGENINYGLGWNISKDRNGHRMWFHAGNLPGGSAYLVIYPDDDLILAFLANTQEGLLFNVEDIGELFYNRK